MTTNDIFGAQPTAQKPLSLADIEAEFSRPTQAFDAPAQGDIPPELINPDNEPEPAPSMPTLDGYDDAPADEPVSPERARRTGERIARLIDTGFSFAAAGLIAKSGKQYKAAPADLSDIADAWGEVAQEHNISLGPEWTLVVLYLMVYGPLLKEAFDDRRLRLVEEEQERQRLVQEMHDRRLREVEAAVAAAREADKRKEAADAVA